MTSVEDKCKVNDVQSPTIVKIAFIVYKYLLTTSKADYKSVMQSIGKKETGASFSHATRSLINNRKHRLALYFINLLTNSST